MIIVYYNKRRDYCHASICFWDEPWHDKKHDGAGDINNDIDSRAEKTKKTLFHNTITNLDSVFWRHARVGLFDYYLFYNSKYNKALRVDFDNFYLIQKRKRNKK